MKQNVNSQSLETLILDYLKTKPQIKRWVVAYSGGLDSTALIHLVVNANKQLEEPKALMAIHVNHGLSENADSWQEHCETVAQALGIELLTKRVTVENQGQGLEAAAREQRYLAFTGVVTRDDAVLTAHHEDDQSETFLLRLLRGAGVQGLAAIAEERSFNESQLLRPLLNIPRHRLEEYAGDKNLQWINDESNDDTTFDRNFLRQEVIPLLTKRWQRVKSRLAETSERLQAAQKLLNDLAEIDLQSLSPKQERYGQSIDWNALEKLDSERVNNVLRFWCLQQGLSQPSTQHLNEIHRQFFSKEAMLTQACVEWAGCEIRQYQQRLYLMPTLPAFIPSKENMPWDLNNSKSIDLQAYGAGVLSLSTNSTAVVSIRWREGGERCTPVGRSHSQLLKKLLQEYGLETWLRDRVPLLYIDEQLVAVADLWLCQSVESKDAKKLIDLDWSFPIVNNIH